MERTILRVECLGRGGAGLARLPNGRLAAVARALPGELVEVRVMERDRRPTRFLLERVLESSARRVDAPCPWFAACGGCHLQHLTYADQLEEKRLFLERHLRAVLGDAAVAVVAPIAPAPRPLGYRTRNVFTVRHGQLGFSGIAGEHVAVERCAIAVHGTDDILECLRDWLASDGRDTVTWLRRVLIRVSDSSRLVMLVGATDMPARGAVASLAARLPGVGIHLNAGSIRPHRVFAPESVHVAGPMRFQETVGPIRLDLSPTSFTQVNTEVAAALYGRAVAELDPGGEETALDLFCGSGALARHLARRVRSVTAVELEYRVLADARASECLDGTSGITWRAGRAERIARRLWIAGRRFALATLNPPRMGLPDDLPEMLPRLGVRRLAYISCSPPTLARDLGRLVAQGYRLRSVLPFDQFAQTYHLEVLAVLESSVGGA